MGLALSSAPEPDPIKKESAYTYSHYRSRHEPTRSQPFGKLHRIGIPDQDHIGPVTRQHAAFFVLEHIEQLRLPQRLIQTACSLPFPICLFHV